MCAQAATSRAPPSPAAGAASPSRRSLGEGARPFAVVGALELGGRLPGVELDTLRQRTRAPGSPADSDATPGPRGLRHFLGTGFSC